MVFPFCKIIFHTFRILFLYLSISIYSDKTAEKALLFTAVEPIMHFFLKVIRPYHKLDYIMEVRLLSLQASLINSVSCNKNDMKMSRFLQKCNKYQTVNLCGLISYSHKSCI